jgi:UDP-N-acetylmuramate dehydrogenase
MESLQHFSLKHHNSFNISAISPAIYFPKSIDDLLALPDLTSLNFYILGEGSNTLFVDDITPIIIKPNFQGVDITEEDDSYIVTVGAGENWHNLVTRCIEQGINGLENLALIPGSVGAAPVQNIGAYGVELSNYCQRVTWFQFTDNSIHNLSKEECKFSYRNSVFKQYLYNKGIITEVQFRFPKQWVPNISYSGLDTLSTESSAHDVMKKVIEIRQSKLPDPKVLPNAGSFFKNPIVDQDTYKRLISLFPDIPSYTQDNDNVKLAAGWMIEQVGLKGYKDKGVGVHVNQALVLVNYESDLGKDVIAMAKYVQAKVKQKFDVIIVPEVRLISGNGELDFAEINVTDGKS